MNSHANVCQVLEGEKFHAMAGVELLRYVDRPRSGQGANLVIEFRVLLDNTAKPEGRYVVSGTAQLWSTGAR